MNISSITRTAALVAAIALFSIAEAQESAPARHNRNHVRTLEGFRTSLKSDVPGIVESTIYNVLIYKKLHSDLDYSSVITQLNQVARNYQAPSISYKAYLATMYFNLGSKIEIVPQQGEAGHQDLFRQISSQLERNLLVSNDMSAQ